MGLLLSKKKNRKKMNDKLKIEEVNKKKIKINLNSIKLALLGDSAVGKSSICQSFLKLDYLDDCLANILPEKIEKKISLNNGKEVKLILFDTAGQERFRSIAMNTARSVHGIIIVFDVTSITSFRNLGGWLENIEDRCGKDAIIALFGNKVDMVDRRVVSEEEIETYVKKKNLVYFEISARNNIGVDEGISYLANKIYNKIIKN